jgi:isopropylmalate/homocitrate/citramalate synthase
MQQDYKKDSIKESNVTVFNTDPTLFLDYQIQKEIKKLYKEYLFLVEKLFNGQDETMQKLRACLPDQYKIFIDTAEFLTDSKYEETRKEILDRGNASIRNISEELKKYSIDFKK